ncbi:restriction endonuclease subunit S [Hypericibacter terrae]|uniref:restriction endonuclease subunit S n=1 Tax=Hypericibacter terrae TaxID=2602015 RepID=UPI003898FC0A
MSEIAECSLGKMLDKAKNKGEPRPYLRNLNVRWFDFDLSNLLEMRFLPEEAAKYRVAKGDLVICEGGYPGRAAIWDRDEPIYFQKALHRVRFHQPENAKWCLYYLHAQNLDGTLKSHFNGAGIQHFTGEALSRFQIPIPPLPEQQRIVDILDKAFDGIAIVKINVEKNLQNARALFESHLQTVFTQRSEDWVEKRLEQIGTTQTGSTPKTAVRTNYGTFIPFVKPADFNKDGSLVYENAGLSEKGLEGARKVTAGSVLMVCIGATIGKCGYCDRDITTNQQINALTPSEGISHKFVYYQMLSGNFQQRVLGKSGQATLPIINKSKWSALTVVLPPNVEEQTRIVGQLDALVGEIQRLESSYQQRLVALDTLKKSLLHQAFSGQL